MHSADLLSGQGDGEEIDGGHLSAEDTLFVQLWSGPYVAFVIHLNGKNTVIKNIAHI